MTKTKDDEGKGVEEKKLIEKLADIEHTRWAFWQSYLHSICTKKKDGSLVIPAESVAWWGRQIRTAYEDLSEKEKQMDRIEVLKYLPVVKSHYKAEALREAEEAIKERTHYCMDRVISELIGQVFAKLREGL